MRWLWQLIPSFWGGLTAVAGITWLALGALFAGTTFLLEYGSGHHVLSSSVAVITVPVGALILAIAALFPGPTVLRALMLVLVASVLLGGGTSCASLLVDAGARPVSAWFFGLGMYGSFAMICLVAAFGLLSFTPHWIHQELQLERGAWLVTQLRKRGVLSIADVEHSLGIDEPALIELAVQQIRRDRIQVRWEGEHDLLLRPAIVADRMQALCVAVAEQGRCSIERLAEPTGLPEAMVGAWIDELIAAGALVASVDRSANEVIYDPAGGAQLGQSWCASCGGPIKALGGGLGRCGGCGVEVEL